MSFFDASALFVIMVTLAMIPSTSVALVITRSATLGFSNGAAVSMGIVVGDLIFVSSAIFGLTALSELMGTFFLVIRYAAGVYLIWLGVTLIRSRAKAYSLQSHSARGGIVASFFAGLFVTLGDVKAIFFYASLFPAFVELSALKTLDIFVILFVTTITVGGVKLTYALIAKKVVIMSKGLAIEKEAKLALGALMVGTGTYLIAKV